MYNVKLLVTLIGLALSLLASEETAAQAVSNFTVKPALSCPSKYKRVVGANLCASNAFSNTPHSAYDGSGTCKRGYARMPGMKFCVLNKKFVHLKKKGGLFFISKADKKKCKASYRKAHKAKFCVDRRLALVGDGDDVGLENMTKVDCAETDIANTNACKSVCQLGFLKSLGKGMCVEWDLARRGHPELASQQQNCADSRYWMRHSEHGLCVPRYNIVSVINNNKTALARETTRGTRCPGGGVPQVTSIAIALSPSSGQSGSQSGSSTGGEGSADAATAVGQGTAIRGFKMAPVVMCSPPDWIRAMQ